MATIAELRDAYPDFLKDKSDTDIVRMLAEKDGLSLPYVAYELGLDPNQYIQNTGRGQDLVNQGILGLGDIVSGVAGAIDIPIAAATGSAPLSTAVDWAADATGLGDYGKRLGVTMSPQSQQTRATMDRQWNDQEAGVWDKTKNIARTLWDDPYYALELGARSASTLVPAIGGVKLLGMGAKALEAAGLARTASGLRTIAPGLAEGGVAAGYQMNNLLEEDVDPREAAGYSALTGVGTGVIGGVTGALGARAGLTDPHRALAGYRLPNEAPALPWYQRIPGGMALEAGQEALQSPWEQAVTNVATGQPWDQGLARSAVEGALAGGIIGAPFNVFRGREIDLTQTQDDTEANPPDPTKGLDTTRFNAPSDVASVRNQVGLNTAEGLSNWAGVRELGDTAGYTGDLAGAYNEPSGHRVADKATGVERELSMGDWLYYQATGQLPPTADPVKVEGKPKPIEGVTPELQRLLDVARNLPMAADPAKIQPGEVTANGHSQKGRPSTKAVEWATKLAGLKTVDEVNKAVEKGTRSKAGYWQWVMPMALARIQEIQAEQAKQSAANTGQPNPETSTEADAQTRVNPTTSSVVAPEGASAVPESGPPPVVPGEDDVEPFLASLTPAQHARAKELGIRKMKDLDIALKAGELDTPPVLPTTSETVPNALSGQTTPQASQTPGTTAPDATPTRPGVTANANPSQIQGNQETVPVPGAAAPSVQDQGGGHRELPAQQGGQTADAGQTQGQGVAKKPPSPVAAKAITGAPLQDWELEETITELGRDVLDNELADLVDNWVKPVPKLTVSQQNNPEKVAAYNAAVAQREARLEQLREAVLDVARNRRSLGQYAGTVPESYDTLAGNFILRDTDGKPLLDENNNPIPLPDVRKGTKHGVWSHAQIRKLDQRLQNALEARGVNFKTVDGVEAPDADPDAALKEAQYDNQTLGASGGVRFQDDALDVSGEGIGAAKSVKDLSNLGAMGQQPFTNDVPTGKGAPKAPATDVEGTAAPVNIWDGEVDLGTDTTFSNIGGGDTGAGNRISGLSTLHWARRAGYDVEGDPPAAKAKAAADLKELHPLARQIWVDAVNQHGPSTRDEAIDASNVEMLDALYRSVSEYQPNEKRIGRVDVSLRKDTDTVAKTKFAEGLYNLHRTRVPEAPDFTGLLPKEVAYFTQATRVTLEQGQNKDRFLQDVIREIVEHRKNATDVRRTGESGAAVGDVARDASVATDQGQTGTGVRETAGSAAAGAGSRDSGNGTSGATEPDIVIGNRDATGVAVKTRRKIDPAAKAQLESDAAVARRAIRAGGQTTPQVQQGLGEDVAATNPTTERTLRDTIASLLGKGHNWRIHVYATPEEAHAAGHTPRKVGNAYGWVEADQKGVKHAYFIVNRIEQGTELGKFLHEVGAHIGLENILSPALYQNLVGQLRKWAAKNDDSLESRLAKAALARVESAQQESTRAGREGLDQAGQDSELIAYFLEEAVKAGVDPTATKANSPLGTWFMRLWTAFKRALRKLRIENLDQLQPQHVVDLAYGAARLELNTYWHGTAANFRKFNHAYMGSGANGQVEGWGSYIAQLRRTGKWYMGWVAKRNGNRASTTVTVDGGDWKAQLDNKTDEFSGGFGPKYTTPKNFALRVVAFAKGKNKSQVLAAAVGKIKESISDTAYFDADDIAVLKQALNWLENNSDRIDVTYTPGDRGNLYRVDVDIRPEEVMHFNKPLSEQPQPVQDILKRHFQWNDAWARSTSGGEFYHTLAWDNGQSALKAAGFEVNDKSASLYLDSLGIKGIEHWDSLPNNLRLPETQRATNLVVFNDKNIYRVARAPGGDTTPGKVQYGVDVPSHVSAISEAVQNQLSKGETGVKSNLLGWLRLDQLADQYGKQIPMVAELNKLFNQMSAKTQHWLGRADQVIRMWDMLTPKQKELMHWIMGNATVEGYDPDDSQTTAKNDQQRLLDQKWQQLQALDAANPKMKAATVYRAARKHYQDDMQEAIDYLNGLKTQAKGANDKQLDSMITTLKALTKKSKGVYFPLMRFGDFYTVGMSSQLHTLHQKRKGLLDQGQALDAAEEKLYQKLRKDAKHYQVTGHDSERQARKHAEKLRAQGMQATSNVGRYTQDAVRNTLSKDMEGFNKILAELEVPKGVASRLQDAYESLLIDALPEGHTLKRQMDRDGIAGWDTDMRRVFAKSTQSRAFALSRLINLRQVQEQMAKLKRAGESFEPNAQLASPLYNELMKRQELAYTRSEDPLWTRVATTWNYLTMLSFSPAFWLLNLSQVPVVTLPWLASRNGNQYGATMTGLAKAAGQTAKMIKWSIEGNEWRAELDTTRTIPGLTQDEKQLLLDMQDAGKLEFTIGQDLGAVAAGKSDWVAKLTRSINTPTHATELINRAATALTAYRISKKNNAKLTRNQGESEADFQKRVHDKAVEFAISASDTTHVNYDPVVGARNMQTVFGSAPLAKIVFQFWKFQQGMAYLALSTLKDAYNHPDPAVKKQARDTAIGMTLTLTSTAGAFGLPFVGSALGLLTLVLGMFGDDDEDKDVPRMIKNWMHDYLPGPVEDYLTKGIWGLMDGPDPSARFSMGGLMNPLAFARFDDTQRGEDTVKEIMFRVFGGATGASASAVLDGLTAVGEGDYAKAGEKLLPLKLLRDLSKAYTLNTEGLTTGKGEQRLDPNDFSVADSLWQAMGIQPAKKTTYYDRQAAIQSQKQAVEGTRDKLLAKYAQARIKGEDVSSITMEHLRYNQRNPHNPILQKHRQQAVDRRRDIRRETDATGMLVNKQTRPYLPNARWTE